MAIRDLIRLIQASGNSAVAGQNYVNHVTGAPPLPSDMVAYEKNGWNSWTKDYSGGVLAYNGLINLTFVMDAGGKWTNIRGGPLTAQANDGTDPTSTGSASVVSGALAVAGNNTIQVQARGGTKIIQTHRIFNGINKQWTDYGTEPNPNPVSIESDIDIIAQFIANGSDTPGQYSYDLHIVSPADGDFNDALDYSFPITVMGNVTYNDTLPDCEWYSDSGYSSLYATGVLARVQSGGSGATSGSLWMRYSDNNAWVNYGQVDWFDPRVYGHF